MTRQSNGSNLTVESFCHKGQVSKCLQCPSVCGGLVTSIYDERANTGNRSKRFEKSEKSCSSRSQSGCSVWVLVWVWLCLMAGLCGVLRLVCYLVCCLFEISGLVSSHWIWSYVWCLLWCLVMVSGLDFCFVQL